MKIVCNMEGPEANVESFSPRPSLFVDQISKKKFTLISTVSKGTRKNSFKADDIFLFMNEFLHINDGFWTAFYDCQA